MHPRKQIAVFGSFLTNDHSAEMACAEEVGYLLARKGFTILCGGHGGIANPLVSGTLKGGGEVVGLSLIETKYPGRSSRMNPLIQRKVEINTLSERLDYFSSADGFIFFTGGIGTLSEFAFMWHSLQLQADFDRPLVLFARGWKRVLAQIRSEQMIKYKYFRLIHLCDHAKEAVAVLSNDYSVKYDDPQDWFFKETILFDFDGTLVESPEEAFIKACENRGYFFALADVVASFREAGRFPAVADDGILFFVEVLENLGLKTPLALELADDVARDSGPTPLLYEDVVPTLRHFKENGFSTGVVSGRPVQQVKEMLTGHDLSRWVDFVCPLNHPEGMPDKKGLAGVLEAFGLKKGRTVYIGDNYQEDYLAPRVLEMDAVLLDRHLAHLAIDTAFKIRSLRELTSLVRHATTV